MNTERSRRIAALNDQLRRNHTPGRILMTAGLLTLGPSTVSEVMARIAKYDAFTDQSDPHDERDFGVVDIAGERVFWKIDYYSPDLRSGSENPADQTRCTRVMTVMLAEEY